jgi:hypothetical protein
MLECGDIALFFLLRREIFIPNTGKKFTHTRVMFPVDGPEGLWKQIIGKDDLDDHLIGRNVEQFYHAGAMPFGYTDLGRELGHAGDSSMV